MPTKMPTKPAPKEFYKSKPQAEINEIALGLLKGEIFHSSAIEGATPYLVFFPLSFLSPEHKIALKDHDIVAFYAPMTSQMERGINGNPIFYKCHLLNAGDNRRVFAAIKRLENALGKGAVRVPQGVAKPHSTVQPT